MAFFKCDAQQSQTFPNGLVTHMKNVLHLLERRIGMFLDITGKFLRVELTSGTPGGFRFQRPVLFGIEISINRTSGYFKPLGGLHFTLRLFRQS